MFGYIVFNKPELKFREYDEYRACYCGICRMLKERSGMTGQLALNYDMTFLSLLLTGLYEPESVERKFRCAPHPLRKHTALINEFSEYCADMCVLLSYYKCADDWRDEKKISRYAYAKLINGKAGRVKERYPKKCSAVESLLSELDGYEKDGSGGIDDVSGCFGRIMSEIFIYKDDEWSGTLGETGFYLGKYIYLIDAYDDIADDLKSGSYNVLKGAYEDSVSEYGGGRKAMEDFSKKCGKLLSMMVTECARQFEKLPIILYAGILRNILYSGVWTRFNDITSKMLDTCDKGED